MSDDQLNTAALADALAAPLRRWLPRQRWYSAKDRELVSVRVATMVPLLETNPGLIHAVVAADDGADTEHYQILLGHRRGLPCRLTAAWIADVDGMSIYAATHDDELMRALLTRWGRQADPIANGAGQRPRFELETEIALPSAVPVTMVSAEQSNTSLVFGDRYIVKLFRRVRGGPHPEIELNRALRSVGSRHIADIAGWIHGEINGQPAALGILQEFLADADDGWELAIASASTPGGRPDSFVTQARQLGRSIGEIHADLARAYGVRDADPADLQATVDRMHLRLTMTLPTARELVEHESALRAVFDRARANITGPHLQRIHGDLHLGQVLRAGGRWRLIDFEGEPGTPLEERNAPRYPLQDVATMLRSFDYAAHHHLLTTCRCAHHRPGDRRAALAWATATRSAFCDGYAEILDDPRATPHLLRALELDKAVYELAYERSNRPEWTLIPLDAINRVLAKSRTT